MRTLKYTFFAVLLLVGATAVAQEEQAPQEKQAGHVNTNKFRQLYNEFATPNQFRTASGAPGPAYYQNEADYEIKIELDDEKRD